MSLLSPRPWPAAAAETWLRRGVAAVWLATGLGVLHPYYRAVGHDTLSRLGLPDLLMYATCAAEVVLGAVLWFRPTDRLQAIAQIGPVLVFTVILVGLEPALLVHPFGVLSKNLPLLGAVWLAWQIRDRGLDPALERPLRAATAIVWFTEGLLPKQLFLSPLELTVVEQGLGVPASWAAPLIHLAGALQIAAGLGVLLLRGRALVALLLALSLGLVGLPGLVLSVLPEMAFHPFGPLSKNLPVLALCLTLARWPGAARSAP